MDFSKTGEGGLANPSPPLEINYVNILQKMNPNTLLFPAEDWYIFDKIVHKFISRPLSISFRILSWVCWARQKWLDTVRIKNSK